jgi:hypothetical protein
MAPSLTDETRSMLAVLARSRTAPAHHVERSAIILHLADRHSASETAAALGITASGSHAAPDGLPQWDRAGRQLSQAGMTRYRAVAARMGGQQTLEAINDLPRSGRPPDITEAARAWLIGEACAKPKERGYPHELWTLRGPRHPEQPTGQAPQGTVLFGPPRPSVP